jgi:hypothetical protein
MRCLYDGTVGLPSHRRGRCHDRTLYGPEGGDLLTDALPRLCFELVRTPQEGLSLYILEEQRRAG